MCKNATLTKTAAQNQINEIDTNESHMPSTHSLQQACCVAGMYVTQ